MGVGYLAISAAFTALSFVGLQCWTELSVDKLKADGLISDNFISHENANRALELLLGSYATVALLANFVFNAFILINLCLKTIFFVELYPSETRKLVERLINYVIYKGTFLPLVIPGTIFQAGLWSIWLTVLCSLKMFQVLARDRLERLNASPSALPWTYFRVYSALLLVLFVDFFWIRLCLVIYRTLGSSMFLLLFFEPFSIAFETMQAMLVHGFQLLDIWLHHSAGNSTNCQRFKFFDAIAAGSLSEWKNILIRNLGFSLDMATLLMALGHYMHIWWLHGVAFHLVDAVLFLNTRALLSAIIKRVKGYAKLRIALGALHAALPDATYEELRAYDDECAICREPMAKAKKLHCSHIFHLACLRSWLDQGLNEMYSCPTCRKPLFVGRPDNEANRHGGDILSDEQLARQISEELDQQTTSTLSAGVLPNQTHNSIEGRPWRSAGSDSSWLHTWPGQSVDGAGPSTAMRSVGMMMRHLASVGETYAQTALEDAAWSLWPMNHSQAVASGSTVTPSFGRSAGGSGGLHMRTASRSASDNMVNMLAMAETVREVLPHIPDELILQDLQRTNSVTVTVNNLLQM
ncbi:hypothetical protein P3X46_030692 [Hevea brasiliensis]|uniref:RING-type domain-containing protein n=1 Tax=Hevea brasiliensis TaxID=3981 RepID=A0ABQ9KHY9_HEVBR|nr:E3 ubiquitin protein ligase RIN2 [Hevea brasiliensis]XP_021671583.2 E3 ubiquitin protein ligase RIN2 [Hevea brasiliensis]XP_021671584.2 E3 ubiquitin protein ligase RIN2 [Hevea brasiliensis]XP_021671586.2 E3 ubiquitin protein ligase RIN2 [Hevea brasiliensis]KAJ9140004.1 hypothetical protein P3X46_030692 [Hevea brasiliensis]